jgi:ADP-heptose:LPS heptosyltransferase
MSQTELLVSIPGEWMDRRGRSQPKGPIRRIAIVKPDHIGDLLIASRAFGLLRHYFPRARLELICGPWNVALARQLGLFDEVHGIALFHEISGKQQDVAVARAMQHAGIGMLEQLRLGSFDIAIDMRHDRDSRPLLLSLDARVYAGYGSTREYPFLDIVLPTRTDDGNAARNYEVFLGGHNFHRIAGAMDPAGMSARGSGLIVTEKHDVELDLVVRGAKSPAACGTVAADQRRLGIALRSISLAPVADGAPGPGWRPLKLMPSDPSVALLSGWAGQETWGVWGEGELCRLRIALPPSQGERHVRVDLALLGHVNPANPLVECDVRIDGGAPAASVVFAYPANQGVVSVEVARADATIKLASEPFRLAPGSYRGLLRAYVPMSVVPATPLTLRLRGLVSAAALMTCSAGRPTLRTGLCDIPFACEIEAGNEPLSLEVEVADAPGWEGTRIEMLTIECTERMKLNGPIAHMEQLASLLVLRVAMEFSQEPPFVGDDIAERLTAPAEPAPAGPGAASGPSAAEELRRRILDWRRAGYCVVGMGLGCNTEIRKWPLHYFIDLARALLALGRVRLLFVGSPADAAEADGACRMLGLDPAVHSACGRTALHELGRLLQPLDLFIGSNTGTTHFAGRVGVRTVGIYSGTNHPREWAPIGENASWITRDEKCAPCSLTDIKDCHFGHVCMRNLLPADVLPLVVPEVLTVLSERFAAAA